MGYVNCKGGERRFEYCPVDVSSIAGIPQIFIERFNIREKMIYLIFQMELIDPEWSL